MGPLLFLIYVNDMPQAVKSNLFLYADDSCLVFQGKDVIEIEKQLNEDFTNICEWFVDNRLSIHFGEDKTKSILFASKTKNQRVRLNYATTYHDPSRPTIIHHHPPPSKIYSPPPITTHHHPQPPTTSQKLFFYNIQKQPSEVFCNKKCS